MLELNSNITRIVLQVLIQERNHSCSIMIRCALRSQATHWWTTFYRRFRRIYVHQFGRFFFFFCRKCGILSEKCGPRTSLWWIVDTSGSSGSHLALYFDKVNFYLKFTQLISCDLICTLSNSFTSTTLLPFIYFRQLKTHWFDWISIFDDRYFWFQRVGCFTFSNFKFQPTIKSFRVCVCV